jgi:NAD(P)-dependent dehydrogenase (short-subunit alcohol dehydrogenase family)
MAKLLIEEGATVFVSDLLVELGEQTAADLGCTFLAHDVTSEEAWQNVMARIRSSHGRLDVLVNNAGVANLAGPKDPEQAWLETWRKIVSVNGESVFLGCKWAIPLMRESGGGSIINISSVAGMIPAPLVSAYGFSKAGVRHFTKSVALYCAPMGIRCNSVHPGQIETDMIKGMMEELGPAAGLGPEDTRAAFLAAIPQGHFQTARDVAYGVLFLASDESRCITGMEMVIDGGMILSNSQRAPTEGGPPAK